jgi:hypothetical protein
MPRLFILWLSIALCVGACTNAPYKQPPSTAAAQQAVNSARGNVDSASVENQSAMAHNRKARTKAEQIDNKASVIDRYWK